MVIPWPPGGSNDIAGRIVVDKLSELSGLPFVVENRGGRSGAIGSELVAKSPPDGYTIMVVSSTHIANPHLYKKLPYDALKDFAAVAPISAQIGVLVVHPSMPVRTTKDLIAMAKARPGQIVYGSSGVGAFPHLAMALLAATARVHMVHVTYKGGGPAAAAIGSGDVQVMIATMASVASQVEAGRVRPLAVTSNQRVQSLPKVPTIAESGVPSYEFTGWIGVLAPAGTPKPIIDKLNTHLQRVLQTTRVIEQLKAQGLEPMFTTAEQFEQRLRSDYDKYGRIIKLTGASAE